MDHLLSMEKNRRLIGTTYNLKPLLVVIDDVGGASLLFSFERLDLSQQLFFEN
jgi:hypothetical protein